MKKLIEEYTMSNGDYVALLENGGRRCYYVSCDDDKVPNDLDPAELPHIEDTNESIQSLYKELIDSDNNMVYIDDDNIDCFLPAGVSVDDYISSLKAEVQRLHIDDYITFNEDGFYVIVWMGLVYQFSFAG